MKKAMTLALGIVTAVGGFFDVGNIATCAQAGSSFRFQLLWAMILATLIIVVLVEMSGRFSAVSGKALPDAIREHFGFAFWSVPFVVLTIVHIFVLAAEIGGIAFALHLVSGLSIQLLALPVGVLVWVFLWRSTFSTIENSSSGLGLVTLCFVIAAWVHHPPAHELIAGALPSMPSHDPAKYWFMAVSLIGAVIAPYLLLFIGRGGGQMGRVVRAGQSRRGGDGHGVRQPDLAGRHPRRRRGARIRDDVNGAVIRRPDAKADTVRGYFCTDRAHCMTTQCKVCSLQAGAPASRRQVRRRPGGEWIGQRDAGAPTRSLGRSSRRG